MNNTRLTSVSLAANTRQSRLLRLCRFKTTLTVAIKETVEIQMKYALCIAVSLVVLYGLNAEAQQQQVRCKSLLYGDVQVFNGMQCPAGWAPV